MRVLQSVREPTGSTNPYVIQLVDSVRATGVEVDYFTWRRALLGRYDALHFHWPEVALRRSGRLARAAARARFAMLLVRLTALRTPVVRTVHNVGAHEPGDRVEELLLRWCERRTTFWVLLNSATPLPRPGPSELVPHGHYTDWYAGHPPAERVPGRLLTFGLLRPYKGTDALLDAFAGLPDPDVGLHVVGRPTTDGMRELVRRAAATEPRLTAVLRHVDDATLAAEVGEAQLVVLPYRELHNSGALLLALSLGRPALVPSGPSAKELAAEVGPGWVLTYSGTLTAEVLAKALAATIELPAAPPDLSRRDWPRLADRHAAIYRTATANRAGARGSSRRRPGSGSARHRGPGRRPAGGA